MSFLEAPEPDAAARAIFAEDVGEIGYVMNASRIWAHQPATMNEMFSLMRTALSGLKLNTRQRGILIGAAASGLGDSYCSLMWGTRLSASDPAAALSVLRAGQDGLSERELAMASWARQVARDPNGTSGRDVAALRAVGFDDAQIFAITAFVAVRIAFSTVNDALGIQPDAELRSTAPAEVLAAVDYGRPVAD